MSAKAGRALRILWVFCHRTARYEEVAALLREGFEVVPVEGVHPGFPNAVEMPEDEDPWTRPWRDRCSIPADDLELLRSYDYASPAPLPRALTEALNQWVDVVVVGTFPAIAYRLLRSFGGAVVLRVYGGYPYSASLGPWPIGSARLSWMGRCERYAFCPAIPYQHLVEDSRLTRGRAYWPACVTRERFGVRWSGAASNPVGCEVISLISRYRQKEYAAFVAAYGSLPFQLLGQNEPGGPTGKDSRIVGTLPDEEYFREIASSRLMLYAGIGSKYHLHYHALEALMMGVPVVFFEGSALAHMARFHGLDDAALRAAGMVSSCEDGRALAARLLGEVEEAVDLAGRQADIRAIFEPAPWDRTIGDLIRGLGEPLRYTRSHADPMDGKNRRDLIGLACLSAHRVRARGAAAFRRFTRP